MVSVGSGYNFLFLAQVFACVVGEDFRRCPQETEVASDVGIAVFAHPVHNHADL